MYKKIFILSALLLTTVVACKNKPSNAEAQATAETTEQTSATANGENGAQAVIRQVDPNLSGAEALETIKKNYTGKVAFFKSKVQSSFTSPEKPRPKTNGRTV